MRRWFRSDIFSSESFNELRRGGGNPFDGFCLYIARLLFSRLESRLLAAAHVNNTAAKQRGRCLSTVAAVGSIASKRDGVDERRDARSR